ncbi:MAG: hypothetical protein HBSAPP03_07530 [Phycisphaerae bacterium]|nr:MAG: hypothetical protein HBSAPP03_07530 [Phycisphaerae bacterium]
MKCDHCDNEATVHEVTVRNGKKVERHLCEVHAAEAGIAVQPAGQMGELIKQHMAALTQSAAAKVTACPTCRTTFAEFKQHGILGCADCYKAFARQLGPLIERAHEGGVKHRGKVCKVHGEGAADAAAAERRARAQRLSRLRAELDHAVRAEQYEQAAKLRDELRAMGERPPQDPA